MPIPLNVIRAADQVQQNAASDAGPQIRLIAGAGTGKSSAIEKSLLVAWADYPDERDLRRIFHTCVCEGLTGTNQLTVRPTATQRREM
jgi:hypothetical protein